MPGDNKYISMSVIQLFSFHYKIARTSPKNKLPYKINEVGYNQKKKTHIFIRKKLMIAYLEFIDMSIYIYTRIKIRIFFSYPKKKKSKHKIYIFF